MKSELEGDLRASLLAHQGWMRVLARHLAQDPYEADDLVQRTWLKVLGEGGVRSRTWLGTVMRNLWRNDLRDRTNRQDYESRFPPEAEVHGPEDDLWIVERRQELVAHIAELAPKDSSVLLMHYFDGKSARQIASELGQAEGTVHWRMKEARDHLRERLEGSSTGREWLSALLPWASQASGAERVELAGLASRGSFAITPAAIGLCIACLAGGWLLIALKASPGGSAGQLDSALSGVKGGRVAALAPGDGLGGVPGPAPERLSPELGQQVPSGPAVWQPPLDWAVRVEDPAGRLLSGVDVFVDTPKGLVKRGTSNAQGLASLRLSAEDFHGSGFTRTGGLAGIRALPEGGVWSPLLHFESTAGDEGSVVLVVDPEPRGAELSVTLVGPDEVPIAGARVSVLLASGLEQIQGDEGRWSTYAPWALTSDREGRIRMPGAPVGGLRLRVNHPEYPHHLIPLVFEPDHGPYQFVVPQGARVRGTLAPWPETQDRSARVWHQPLHFAYPIDGDGLSGYEAQWLGFVRHTLANRDGEFELPGVPTGRVRLFAQSLVQPERVATTVVELVPGQEWAWNPQLLEQAPIEVRVTDAGGAPLEGRQVFIRNLLPKDDWIRLPTTDAEGWVRLYDWLPGEHSVLAFEPLLVSAPFARSSLEMPGPGLLTLQAAQADLRLLEGRVLDASGAPFPDVELQLARHEPAELGALGVGESEGEFSGELPAGRYEIMVFSGSKGVFCHGSLDLSHEQRGLLIQAPKTQRLLPPAQPAPSPAGLSFRLQAHAWPGHPRDRLLDLCADEGELPSGLDLFPGTYRYQVHRGDELVHQQTVVIEPGQDLRLAPCVEIQGGEPVDGQEGR